MMMAPLTENDIEEYGHKVKDVKNINLCIMTFFIFLFCLFTFTLYPFLNL